MLTKDVLTAFRGRGDEVRVYPASFKEYYAFTGGDRSDAYEEYALYGGMPLVFCKKGDAEKMSYLKSLFTEVYFRDIIERYDIELPDVLEKLTDDLCLSVGLRNARLGFRQQEETHIMENIIYNELLCRGYSVDVGVVEIVEYRNGSKSKKQCEIDFVVNLGAKKYYIQSAFNVNDPSKLETELRPLRNTKDFFKKIIISKTSMKPWTDDEGILHLGLYEFLLNENSLEL